MLTPSAPTSHARNATRLCSLSNLKQGARRLLDPVGGRVARRSRNHDSNRGANRSSRRWQRIEEINLGLHASGQWESLHDRRKRRGGHDRSPEWRPRGLRSWRGGQHGRDEATARPCATEANARAYHPPQSRRQPRRRSISFCSSASYAAAASRSPAAAAASAAPRSER